MGRPFSDITIYYPIPHKTGTAEYWEDRSLLNFICDLYVQCMNGYNPPKTTRITIQPAYHEIWNSTWKNGSIVAIAPFFSYDEYSSLSKSGKYKYILGLIQTATMELSDEYQWEKQVFEKAYNKILSTDFSFRIETPAKQSRDRKKKGVFVITKNETITSAYVEISFDGQIITRKLFDKENGWCHDSIYPLAKKNRWFDNNRFGVGVENGKIAAWYSVNENLVELFDSGKQVTEINIKRFSF